MSGRDDPGSHAPALLDRGGRRWVWLPIAVCAYVLDPNPDRYPVVCRLGELGKHGACRAHHAQRNGVIGSQRKVVTSSFGGVERDTPGTE